MIMLLTKDDKKQLRKWGHTARDYRQIELVSTCCLFTLYTGGMKKDKLICADEALEALGRREFLSGLSRCAFHWSATRTTEDGKSMVSFDASPYFRAMERG